MDPLATELAKIDKAYDALAAKALAKINKERGKAKGRFLVAFGGKLIAGDLAPKVAPKKKNKGNISRRPGNRICWARKCGKKAGPGNQNWCLEHAKLGNLERAKIKLPGEGKWKK